MVRKTSGLGWLGKLIASLDPYPAPPRKMAIAREILARSDANAFRQDWQDIGLDFWNAMGQMDSLVPYDTVFASLTPEQQRQVLDQLGAMPQRGKLAPAIQSTLRRFKHA